MEENKALLELLQKIEKTNRQQVRLTRLVCIFALLAACACVCTLGLVYTVLPQITDIASQAQAVLGNLEETADLLSGMDVSGMVEDVDILVTTAQSSLEQTMGKLNSIDFKSLNQAIQDLANVVEPLSKLVNVFK